MFKDSDLEQMKELGIKLTQVETQLENFKAGFPFLKIIAPANLDNRGVLHLNEVEMPHFISIFEKACLSKRIIKFVPASGAATRMFKDLFSFSQQYAGNYDSLNKDFPEVEMFLGNLEKFAFYDDLVKCMSTDGLDLKKCLHNHDYVTVIDYVLNNKGLGYANLPKALIKFHAYSNFSRTALEEHLVEGIHYVKNQNNEVFIHFTISPEHKPLFLEKLKEVQSFYEKKFNVSLKVSFSEQKAATDTIAATEDNEPFRDANGKLVFRPGGHGALIENLNDCDADIIFIKNIDNVVPDHLKEKTNEFKKACAGLLLLFQNRIFDYLYKLDLDPGDFLINEIETFIETELFREIPERYKVLPKQEKVAILKQRLNRPIRVCGMVKNQGEPGGGPFWVERNNYAYLQILESSQINHDDPEQEDLFRQSSFFNPVDLVCSVKDYKKNKFDLRAYTDPQTGFISLKSKDGKTLKAQELPGLWNGAMSNWLTLFVEVPLLTFNPVKTVNDLLRPEHQTE